MLSEVAYAQSPAARSESPAFLQFGPLIIILVLAYVLLLRPQLKQEKQHRAMLANLKRNDEVTTGGGLYGRIMALTDAVVTLEVAPNVQVRVDRSQIKNLVKSQGGEEKERRRERDKEKGKS